MQNAFWQTGSDCKWFLSKKVKNFNGTRDPLPPPSWQMLLKFPFFWDFGNPFLICCYFRAKYFFSLNLPDHHQQCIVNWRVTVFHCANILPNNKGFTFEAISLWTEKFNFGQLRLRKLSLQLSKNFPLPKEIFIVHWSISPKIPKNVPKIPKNTQKCPKIPKNAQKYPKIPEIPEIPENTRD